MARTSFTRYSEFVAYDLDTGALLVFDPGVGALVPVEQPDPHSAPFTGLARLEPLAHAFALGFTLAMVAREWRNRPTDAQRGAIIQMAERLKPAAGSLVGLELLAAARNQADAALVRGQNAEHAIASYVHEQMRLASRAADRCGRHAVNLVDSGDQVLTYGFGGPPLLALLGALPDLEAPVTLITAGDTAAASLLQKIAGEAGIAAHLLESSDTAAAICVFVAVAVARDGSALCASGSGPLLELMRARGVPGYILAPAGPHPSAETAAQLALPSAIVDIVLPDLISAIVTDRGMYRPAMIERYLGENDAPPDVIPLL